MDQPDPTAEQHEHHEGTEVHAHQPHSALERELVSHLPLSVAGAAIGLALAGLICFMAPAGDESEPALHREVEMAAPAQDHDHAPVDEGVHDHHHTGGFRPLFHLFHPLHMLFSAAATTAMFWRYDRRFIRTVVVGLIGAIGVCGISDILIPHVALIILGKQIPFHICVIEHPGLVLPFAAIGIAVGLVAAIGVTNSTFFSHALHVFVSTMASIFYMVNAYERLEWITQLGWIFVFVIIAVVGPCCVSDIVFPVAMSKSARRRHAQATCCH